jgi:DNA-binding NarL/FixJ family response regulator
VINHFHKTKPASELDNLSPRELELLRLLAKGHRYKEIADELSINIGTVRTHINHIYEKLHVSSRTEAAMKLVGQ